MLPDNDAQYAIRNRETRWAPHTACLPNYAVARTLSPVAPRPLCEGAVKGRLGRERRSIRQALGHHAKYAFGKTVRSRTAGWILCGHLSFLNAAIHGATAS